MATLKMLQTEQEYKKELLEEQAAKIIQRGLMSRFKKKIPFVKMLNVTTRLVTLNILTISTGLSLLSSHKHSLLLLLLR